MLMTHYSKQFGKIVIMFCTHIYQKTSINTIILGNAHIAKPSIVPKTTYLSNPNYIMHMLYKNCY